jgi:hypothetical protein
VPIDDETMSRWRRSLWWQKRMPLMMKSRRMLRLAQIESMTKREV